MKYLNNNDRSDLIVLYAFWDFFNSFLDKSKVPSDKVRSQLREANEDMFNGLQSIMSEFDTKFASKIVRDLKHTIIQVKSDAANPKSSDSVTVNKYDLAILIDHTKDNCSNCTIDKFYLCDKYNALIGVNADISDTDSESCPFKSRTNSKS